MEVYKINDDDDFKNDDEPLYNAVGSKSMYYPRSKLGEFGLQITTNIPGNNKQYSLDKKSKMMAYDTDEESDSEMIRSKSNNENNDNFTDQDTPIPKVN